MSQIQLIFPLWFVIGLWWPLKEVSEMPATVATVLWRNCNHILSNLMHLHFLQKNMRFFKLGLSEEFRSTVGLFSKGTNPDTHFKADIPFPLTFIYMVYKEGFNWIFWAVAPIWTIVGIYHIQCPRGGIFTCSVSSKQLFHMCVSSFLLFKMLRAF